MAVIAEIESKFSYSAIFAMYAKQLRHMYSYEIRVYVIFILLFSPFNDNMIHWFIQISDNIINTYYILCCDVPHLSPQNQSIIADTAKFGAERDAKAKRPTSTAIFFCFLLLPFNNDRNICSIHVVAIWNMEILGAHDASISFNRTER